MELYVGQDWTKLRSGHTAQISALDSDTVYLYWPDRDTQTSAARKRFGWSAEWQYGLPPVETEDAA